MLPIFKSHYSLSRSILTLEKAGDSLETGPKSIIDLALKHNFKQVILVDDNFSGFLEAYKNCEAAKLQLIFGIRLTFCENMEDKSEASLTTNCKYVIKIKTNDGYKRLIKIYSLAATDGFYYEPRIDFKRLKELWSEEDLQLCVPFYDSFLFNNSLQMSRCVPDFSFATPVLFLESNELPFDFLVEKRVKEFAEANKLEIVPVKSIYYEKREDFKAFCCFRCISTRSTLDRPQLEHMSSPEFCLEAWLDNK